MALVFAIMQSYDVGLVFLSIFLSIEWSTIPACSSFIRFFNKVKIEELTL